jgi:putative transposase
MTLIANIRLTASVEKAGLMRRFLDRVNEPCSWLTARASDAGTSPPYELHKLRRRGLRERFELMAQVASCCMPRKFRKHAAQPYDDRIVSLRTNNVVSIRTLKRRLLIKSKVGKRQRDLLVYHKGEVDLAGVAAACTGCPGCGVIDDKNRPNQAIFSCGACGHSGHADVIAARNIVAGQRPHS